VDYDIGFASLEDLEDFGEIGDIAVVVNDTIRVWTSIAGGEEVEDGDFGGIRGEDEVNNMVAEEAAAADN
jgi:hypothetical protein